MKSKKAATRGVWRRSGCVSKRQLRASSGIGPSTRTRSVSASPTGLLRELIKTRYGFHIVAIDQRIPGTALPFELVRDGIAERLRSAVEEKALRQYVSMLAGQATIEGADLAGSQSPLIQ